MNRTLSSFVCGLGLLLLAGAAFAQTPHSTVKANIPFPFVVEKAAMPAGLYSIESIGTAGSRAMLIRSSSEARVVLANSAESKEIADKTTLVFHRYGDRYFLAQIWVEGNRTGRHLPISSREAEMAKLGAPHEDVIVLASLR